MKMNNPGMDYPSVPWKEAGALKQTDRQTDREGT